MHTNERLSACSSEALKGTYFSEQPSAAKLRWQQGGRSRPPKVLENTAPRAAVGGSGGGILLTLQSTKALEDSRYTKQCVLLPLSIHMHHLLDFQAALE